MTEPERQSERELELEARVIALEYLLKQCLAHIIIHAADELRGDRETDPQDLAIREAKLYRKKIVKELTEAFFSAPEPTSSDHLAALVRDQADRIVRELVQEMEDRRGPRPSTPDNS